MSLSATIRNGQFAMKNIHPSSLDYKRSAPSFVLARIQPRTDGTFVPTESGQWAVTLGVDDRDGRLVDFLAYFLNTPGTWWLRRREIPILGAETLSRAEFYQQPLRLFETPHDWLKARGGGVCVLSWDIDLLPIFQQVSPIICQSARLKSRLKTSFNKHQPRITVQSTEVRRAA